MYFFYDDIRDEREISLSYSCSKGSEVKNIVTIEVTKELEDFHKEQLHIYEGQVEEIVKEMTEIGKKMSKTKGFLAVAQSYDTIDWYEGGTDDEDSDDYGTYTPIVEYSNKKNSKGSHITIRQNYVDYIPKDWVKNQSCYLIDVKTTNGIFLFLEALDISIDEKQRKAIKKSFKEKKSYDFKLYDEEEED